MRRSFRPFVAACLALAMLAAPASAKDLGVRGATWPVAEPDLLERIEARLADMERSGELARFEGQARARAQSRLEAPEPVPGIAPAHEARSRTFDPSIVVDRDLRAADGTLLVAAGTRVDPFEHATLTRDLLFIDGRRPTEVAWALAHRNPSKIVLLAGRPLALARRHGRPFFFDQGGRLAGALRAPPRPRSLVDAAKACISASTEVPVSGPGSRRRERPPRNETPGQSPWRQRLAFTGPRSGRFRVGPDLHRPLREPDRRRLLGVPVPASRSARSTIGSATGAPDTPEPGIADLPLRLADPAGRARGRCLGAGPARRRDAHPLVLPEPRRTGPSDPGLPRRPRAHRFLGRRRRGQGSVWHAHLLRVPAPLVDRGAPRPRLPRRLAALDIAWTSELDPAWLDDELSFLLNPEATLFANLPAQAACAADCAAASSAGLPLGTGSSGARAARAGCTR